MLGPRLQRGCARRPEQPLLAILAARQVVSRRGVRSNRWTAAGMKARKSRPRTPARPGSRRCVEASWTSSGRLAAVRPFQESAASRLEDSDLQISMRMISATDNVRRCALHRRGCGQRSPPAMASLSTHEPDHEPEKRGPHPARLRGGCQKRGPGGANAVACQVRTEKRERPVSLGFNAQPGDHFQQPLARQAQLHRDRRVGRLVADERADDRLGGVGYGTEVCAARPDQQVAGRTAQRDEGIGDTYVRMANRRSTRRRGIEISSDCGRRDRRGGSVRRYFATRAAANLCRISTHAAAFRCARGTGASASDDA